MRGNLADSTAQDRFMRRIRRDIGRPSLVDACGPSRLPADSPAGRPDRASPTIRCRYSGAYGGGAQLLADSHRGRGAEDEPERQGEVPDPRSAFQNTHSGGSSSPRMSSSVPSPHPCQARANCTGSSSHAASSSARSCSSPGGVRVGFESIVPPASFGLPLRAYAERPTRRRMRPSRRSRFQPMPPFRVRSALSS